MRLVILLGIVALVGACAVNHATDLPNDIKAADTTCMTQVWHNATDMVICEEAAEHTAIMADAPDAVAIFETWNDARRDAAVSFDTHRIDLAGFNARIAKARETLKRAFQAYWQQQEIATREENARENADFTAFGQSLVGAMGAAAQARADRDAAILQHLPQTRTVDCFQMAGMLHCTEQ